MGTMANKIVTSKRSGNGVAAYDSGLGDVLVFLATNLDLYV